MMRTNDFRPVSDGPRATIRLRLLYSAALSIGLFLGDGLQAAELSVADLQMRPAVHGFVIVSGDIDGEATLGVTIMVELIPRPGSTGNLEFTPVDSRVPLRRGSFSIRNVPGRGDEVRLQKAVRGDVDIAQLGDPWPGQGTFSVFDTDESRSAVLNGAVDDNGTFVAAPVTYSGPLAVFPIKAGPRASGVWDVSLSMSAGASGWEAVETRLIGGTITVTRDACAKDRHCNDRDPCTEDVCEAGVCRHVEKKGRCRDRGNAKGRGNAPDGGGRERGED